MAQRIFRVCVCRTTDEQEHILMFLDTTEEETEHVSVEHERRGWGWGGWIRVRETKSIIAIGVP